MAEEAMTLEDFVRSAENELAAHAVAMVAESPGTLYNPLILQGPPGVGKTHLLNATARRARSRDPELTVLLVTGDELAERVTQAAGIGKLGDLQDALSGAGMLLLDGVDSLYGMDLTQEILASLLHALLERSRQIVLTTQGARSGAAAAFGPLRDVLESAVTIDIEPLSAAGRTTLIRKFAEERGFNFAPDIIRLLADVPTGDVRDLQSILEAVGVLPTPTAGDVYRFLGKAEVVPTNDEFQSFLADVTQTVSVIVETSPWRRRIVQAILRWEGEGIDTGRLDRALRADTPPDVDHLIDAFGRDAERLLQIRAVLEGDPRAATLRDPDALADAEQLLAALAQSSEASSTEESAPVDGDGEDAGRQADEDEPAPRYPWFLDPVRVDLHWTGVEGRMAEGLR